MRPRTQRLPARTLATLLAALSAVVPSPSPGANTNQTPFSKLPHLFFGGTASPILPPTSVVEKYEHALAGLSSPRIVAFSFSIEQVGARNLSQAHRVFREGLNERDETLVVDGKSLPRPDVRVFRNRTNHYDLGAVAPRQNEYEFRLASTQHDGDHDDYSFVTTARSQRAFAVTSVVIDGDRFLPLEVDFHIGAGAMRGKGRLVFAGSDKYWLVREVEVTAHDTAGSSSRERIVWSQYQFPESLPPSTFSSRLPSEFEAEPPNPVLPGPVRSSAPRASGAPSQPPPLPAEMIAPPERAKPPVLAPSTAKPSGVASAHPHARPKPVASDLEEPLATPAILQGPVTPAPLHTAEPAVTTAPESTRPAATSLPGASGSL